MLTFSRRSWHRRLHDYAYLSDPPRSLCPYSWRILFAVLFAPLWPPVAWLDRKHGVDTPFPLRVSTGAAFLTIACLIVYGIVGIVLAHGLIFSTILFTGTGLSVYAMLKIIPWWFDRRRANRRPKVEREPSLVVETIKAAKQKVCPLIDWTEEDTK